MKLENNITQRVKDTVLKVDKNAQVILFGSHARGEAKPDSDWDFLVLTNQIASAEFKRVLWDEITELELEVNQVISTLIYNEDQWESLYKITPLYKSIRREGLKL